MSDYRIGRLNGRYTVSWWADGKRKRYRLDALTAKEAEAEALDVIRREVAPASTITVAAIWQAYRADRAGRPVAETMRYTGLPVLAHFGALRPDQITAGHCRDYTAHRRAAGKSDGSIYTELGHLRMALLWAVAHRMIERAPAIERPQKPAPKDRYLTLPEIDRLLAADCEPHIKLAILLMLTTAGRVAAVLQLTWDRVDFDRGIVNLRLDQIGPRKGRAVVPMNDTLRAALSKARGEAMSDHVVEWHGGPVRSIRNGYQKALTNAGRDGVALHTLRHTAAVHMAEAGVDMETVAQYLGHSNVQTTRNTYARFSPDYLRGAAGVLEFGKIRSVK